MYEIKNRFNGDVIYKSESANNVTEAVEEYIAGLNGKRANLCGADLRGANLCGANLYGADLCGADLCGADLRGADLRGANLCGADLRGAYLGGADLRGANLCGANLCGADLCGADLSGANLYGADLSGANLYGADLCGADLSGANLYGADLGGANLCGADLRGADLRGAYLGGVIFAWSSHDLIAEMLRRSADDNLAKLKVAGLILIQRDWCWKEFCSLDEPREIVDWAMRTLSAWAWEDDSNVPKQLLAWMVANDVPRPVRPKNEEVK